MNKVDLLNAVKPEWFGGLQAGVDMVWAIAHMTHWWDDLVDKDKLVSDEDINNMMRMALVYLPLNPVYQKIAAAAPHFWATIISAYEAANTFERTKDERGLEISHTLRYSAGNLIAYAMEQTIGVELARKYIPDMWKVVVFESFDDYKREHLNV